jgi:hypothetical protein
MLATKAQIYKKYFKARARIKVNSFVFFKE